MQWQQVGPGQGRAFWGRSCLFTLIPGALLVAAIVLMLALLLVKLVWAWTVPELFPGAVATGLVARSISWYTAFKLAIFIAVLAGVAGARRRSS